MTIRNMSKLAERSMNMIIIAFFVVNCFCYGVASQEVAPVSVQDSPISLVSFLTCGVDSHPVNCVKERAGRVLDGWENRLTDEVQKWGADADLEVTSTGRQLSQAEEAPSAAAQKVQLALNELISILQKSLYRSMARKKGGGGGGLDSITISAGQPQGGHDKKKKMKKKKKPVDLHLHQDKPEMMMEEEKGVLNTQAELAWSPVMEKELSGPAKPRTKRGGNLDDEDDKADGGRDLEDGRGKKKKKRKAILKLLLLGAVLKAKIGLLLQLLSAHLQVKFFAIALAGLAINIARFWLDLKKGHQPQKVIYYEHAQHQHHYEHEDQDQGWGGYWSRSINGNDQAKNKESSAYAGQGSASESGDGLAYSGWLGRSDTAAKTQRRRK